VFTRWTTPGLLRFTRPDWTAVTSNFGGRSSMDKPTAATPHLPTREECLQAARRELDAARARRDADYLAGRLSGRRLEVFERLLAEHRPDLLAARRAAEAAQQAAA
jgi:hypothetical protein